MFLALRICGSKHAFQIFINFEVFIDAVVAEQIESLECGEAVESSVVDDVDLVRTCGTKTSIFETYSLCNQNVLR